MMATKTTIHRNSPLLLLSAFVFMLSLCATWSLAGDTSGTALKMHSRRAETSLGQHERNHTGGANKTNGCPCVCSCICSEYKMGKIQGDHKKLEKSEVHQYVLDFTLSTLIVVVLGSFFMFRKSHFSIHVVMVSVSTLVYYLCLV